MLDLHEMVYAWHKHGAEGNALLQEFRRHVAIVTRNYPDAYFELGRRTEEALTSLSNRVFTSCHLHARGAPPFAGRPPFKTYTDEKMSSRPIRYHSFYAWSSVTREQLRDDYQKSSARDPILRWKDQVYRELGTILPQCGEAVAHGEKRPSRWKAPGIHRVRSEAEVVDILRRQPSRELAVLVPMALSLLGHPISRSALCHLLTSVLPPPVEGPATAISLDETVSLPKQEGLGTAERITIRAAVRSAWQELEPLDRILLVGLASGEESAVLLERDPRLRNSVALTRAATRVNSLFLKKILEDVGVNSDSLPRSLADAIYAVLLDMEL